MPASLPTTGLWLLFLACGAVIASKTGLSGGTAVTAAAMSAIVIVALM